MMRGAVIGWSAVSVVDSMSICMLFSVILCHSLLFSVVRLLRFYSGLVIIHGQKEPVDRPARDRIAH